MTEEENDIKFQSEISSDSNKFLEWVKKEESRILLGVLVLLVLIVAGSLYYWQFSKNRLSDIEEQPIVQEVDFNEEEKMDILKSLNDSSESFNISRDEKHNGLDELKEQSEISIQLREFEKVDILNQLSQ